MRGAVGISSCVRRGDGADDPGHDELCLGAGAVGGCKIED